MRANDEKPNNKSQTLFFGIPKGTFYKKSPLAGFGAAPHEYSLTAACIRQPCKRGFEALYSYMLIAQFRWGEDMRLFDTHAHLTDKRFDNDRDTLIRSLPASGVELVMDVACDVHETYGVIALAEKYPFIYAAVGTHPHEAAGMEQAHLDIIRSQLEHEKVLAIGEIGLDYHYDFSPRDVQKKWFALQLELAQERGVPVILHIREAFQDCMDILRAHRRGLKGVMHCFSGSYEIARECLDMGLYIAFGGALTFANAVKQVETAARLPMDRIVIETDCPYMTPAPYRGRRNDPSLVGYVAERLALIRGMDAERAAEKTLENGMALFEM